MKRIFGFLLTAIVFACVTDVCAQEYTASLEQIGDVTSVSTDTLVPADDGYYRHNIYKQAKPIPYPAVNKNNVKFFKRVWRDIDLADEKNSILTPPGTTLIEIIIAAINDSSLTAFDGAVTKKNPTGDAFTEMLTPKQAMQRLTDSVLVPVFDEDGNQIDAKMQLNDFNPASVTRFRIKEDIFYDKQRSRIETRIVGIAPLVKIEAGGEQVSEQPAFWLYFPQARNVFVTKESAVPQLTFDDVFVQHKFTSQIIRESNATEKVQNSEEVEKEISEYKKRTWRY
jgi:gliding motility associated protien GldN